MTENPLSDRETFPKPTESMGVLVDIRHSLPRKTTTLPQASRATLSLEKRLPLGVSIGKFTDDRRKPYYVRFGKGRTIETFEEERDRNERAEKLIELREQEGKRALESFDPAEWKAVVALKQRTGATLQQLEAAWLNRTGQTKPSRKLVEAVEDYLKLRLAEDIREKSDTYRQMKHHLRVGLAGRFGGRLLDEVTTEDLRQWLGGMVNPKDGKPMGSVTLRNYRKNVHTFFKRAIREEWGSKNPCVNVKPPKIGKKDKTPMPIRDIFTLLKENRDEPVVGRLALELFGALRAASAERCREDWIKWDVKAIRMPGDEHKSGEMKFRQRHPEVLWEWLKHASPRMWTEINAGNCGHKKSDAFKIAKVKNPGNGLRHSCASYLIALAGSVGPVSYLMQHESTDTTAIYEGMASQEDAKLFVALTPAAVAMTWEDFLSSQKPKHEHHPTPRAIT